MVSLKKAYELLRALPDVSEKDHFGGDAFVANKRIFATVWRAKGELNLRLTPGKQRDALEMDGEGFSEIDNAWGRQGWTSVRLEFVDGDALTEALKAAWEFSKTASVKPAKKTIRKSVSKKKVRSKK